jgi:AmpE protein
MNDPEGFAALATDEFDVTGTPGDPTYQSALTEKILAREQQLFIAIFWLVVLGFGAAFLVVLNRAWVIRAGDEQANNWQMRLDGWLSWPANRLLVLSMALAGDFTAVMEKMRGHWLRQEHSGESLQQVVNVALEAPPSGESGSLSAALDHLESLQGLLLRCVAIWLILSALWIIRPVIAASMERACISSPNTPGRLFPRCCSDPAGPPGNAKKDARPCTKEVSLMIWTRQKPGSG